MADWKARGDSHRGLVLRSAGTGLLALVLVAATHCSTTDDSQADDGNGDATDNDGPGQGDNGTPRPDTDFPEFGVPTDFLPAFPGAQGFGTDTPGGRGGRVYIVDTLEWDGPGSFSRAMEATEPRIIVFRVSGVIEVDETISLSEENSYVTVAGQTSPGGITFAGAPGSFIENYQTNFHDAVFRFLRFRGRGNYDNVSFNTAHHLVFDHCDFSGATDETFDVTYAHDVTVQWSTINNSDPAGQAYGALIAYNPTANFTFHHNLFAHHSNRCGTHMHWAGGVPEGGAVVEFINNVVYNCSFDAIMYHEAPDGGGDRITFNLVGNYFKAGPDTPSGAYGYRLPSGANAYETDTQYPGRSIWPGGGGRGGNLSTPANSPPVLAQSSDEAYGLVLDWAGALPRDPMNTRVADEVRNGTGRLGRLDDAHLDNAPAPPADADEDGMADDWETEVGLNPQDPTDGSGDHDDDGYTNIEEYINELAASLLR